MLTPKDILHTFHAQLIDAQGDLWIYGERGLWVHQRSDNREVHMWPRAESQTWSTDLENFTTLFGPFTVYAPRPSDFRPVNVGERIVLSKMGLDNKLHYGTAVSDDGILCESHAGEAGYFPCLDAQSEAIARKTLLRLWDLHEKAMAR